MKFLIIDTSTEKSLIVISEASSVLLSKTLPVGLQSSRYLMSAIQESFDQLQITPSSLDAIAVTIGPGSFTGIRVGAAVAKGMAFGCSIPLIGLCSLSAFTSSENGRFASVIDARVGGVYVLIQEKNNEQIIEMSSPELIPIEKMPTKVEGCLSIIGPCFKRLGLKDGIEKFPDPWHLAKIAVQKFMNNDFSGEGELEFSYLRKMEYAKKI